MEKKQMKKLVGEMTEDTLIYITLFSKELVHLSKKELIKTFFSLALIEQHDNPSISSLGNNLKISKSQMTSKMDELAKAGFIKRVPDVKDRRIIRIVLTQEGKNFIKNSQKTMEEDMNQLLSPLSLKEIKELKKSIEIIKNLVLKIQDDRNIE